VNENIQNQSVNQRGTDAICVRPHLFVDIEDSGRTGTFEPLPPET
jgi:hypothetical protein